MLSLDKHLRPERKQGQGGAAAPHGRSDRSSRRYERFPYVQAAVVVRIMDGDVARSSHIMSTRDLGAEGIGLLSDKAFAPGTRLEFLRRDGGGAPLPGTIVHCTRMPDGFHAIGVQFDGLINPLTYVDPNL